MTHMPLEITNFFLAMQAGPPGIAMLQDMFTEDAEYSEPFSGQAEPFRGPNSIAAAFNASRSDAFNVAVIKLCSVALERDVIRVQWTCISKAIPGGQGSGGNEFRIRDGKICALTTTLDEGTG